MVLRRPAKHVFRVSDQNNARQGRGARHGGCQATEDLAVGAL